ncbi:MAG: hypothetical protein BWX92_03140 [Deltaproteobacteria bacterium ADurb.Bin135]|nr:MAG: hypothetical protein BWX92_03140 [Deltaproteobacteria bacterium ADurb.Bin135]
MSISVFKDRFINQLRVEEIPDHIKTEKDFENTFVVPVAYQIADALPGVMLCSHPWKKTDCCEPNCESTLKGLGHRKRGCKNCWAESKSWASVDILGTRNNFDLVGKDAEGSTLAVEIKVITAKNGRLATGEIQRFLGQCAMAASKFNFVIGVCGYLGTLNPKYNFDTNKFAQWGKDNNIFLVFRPLSIERFGNYEIEWVTIRSFLDHQHYYEVDGVELHFKRQGHRCIVGFISGYMWLDKKRGPCRAYLLAHDSKDWGELLPESQKILKEAKEAVYQLLKKPKLMGSVKGNIHLCANA